MSKDLAIDVVLVGVWSVVLGLLGGVLWWQLAPEVTATLTAAGPVLDSDQLPRQIGIDGWFATVAGVAGLLSGILLLALRGRRPVAMVVLVVVGGAIGSMVMLRLGHLLGPTDPARVLAGQPEGATAPLDLGLHAHGLVWLWPAAAAFGAVAQLLVLARPLPREDAEPDGAPDETPDGTPGGTPDGTPDETPDGTSGGDPASYDAAGAEDPARDDASPR